MSVSSWQIGLSAGATRARAFWYSVPAVSAVDAARIIDAHDAGLPLGPSGVSRVQR